MYASYWLYLDDGDGVADFLGSSPPKYDYLLSESLWMVPGTVDPDEE